MKATPLKKWHVTSHANMVSDSHPDLPEHTETRLKYMLQKQMSGLLARIGEEDKEDDEM